MRITRSILTALGGLALAGFGTAASAGGNCNASGTACNPGVAYGPSAPYMTQPTQVNYQQPYSHLNTIQYRQTPVVNITRVQTGVAAAPLNAAPTSFWQGCQPGANAGSVCRRPAPRPALAPIAPRPVVVAPAPRPVVIAAAPQPDLTPRQYGDASFVPGIAHVPTSVVDRSPITRDAALRQNGHALIGTPNLSAPTVSHHTSYSHSSASTGVMASAVQRDGTYWEKASGPTIIDGMLATEILCKKQAAPAPVRVAAPVQVRRQYQVVRPVVGVPVPVPTPVYCDNVRGAQHAFKGQRYGKAGFQQMLGYGTAAASRYGQVWK